MNILVPIHVEALRVSNSTRQQALDALYDFNSLGEYPVSSHGGMVAASNINEKISNLKDEPGIHLHWSIPKAYSNGVQNDSDGTVNFPTLPNRWLVTRFLKDISSGTTTTQMWILESDAYGEVNSHSNNAIPVTIPVMTSDNPTEKLYSLDNTKMGNLIMLDCKPDAYPCWQENKTPSGVTYLKDQLQAPFAYGATFTAYYKNSRGAVGFYDSLEGAIGNLDSANFSVSYSVIGWVSTIGNDIINTVLETYDSTKYPNFQDFLKTAFESELKMVLDDYTKLTTSNYKTTQGLLSGLVSNVNWNNATNTKNYPSAKPEGNGVSVAIGNNSAEAISAYINGVNKGESTQDPTQVVSNMEWLLNAFQYDQLNNLATGTIGVGQIDEYMHNKAFGSKNGGYIWGVKSPANLGGDKPPASNVEITLDLTLAKFLSQLNDIQQSHDETLDKIESRKKKLFMDWSYHVDSLYKNVFKPKDYNNIQEDKTGVYLLDGIAHLFPLYQKAGNFKPISKPATFTNATSYVPEVYKIQTPSDTVPDLSDYSFNSKVNTEGGAVFAQILSFQYDIESLIPNGIKSLKNNLETALLLLTSAQKGGSSEDSFINQTITILQEAQANAAPLGSAFAKVSSSENGIIGQKEKIETSVKNLLKIWDGTASSKLGTWYPISDGGLKPAGYKGTLSSRSAFIDSKSWTAKDSYPGMKSILDELTGQDGNTLELLDTQNAAVYMAIAYMWINSNEGDSLVPFCYNIEMAEQAITTSVKAGTTAIDFLNTANSKLSSFTDSIGQALDDYALTTSNGSLQSIIAELQLEDPDLDSAVAKLEVLTTSKAQSGKPYSVIDMLSAVQTEDWIDVVQNLENAWNEIGKSLSYSQQTYILADFMFGKVGNSYELSQAPADVYWQPNEPVIVLGEGKVGDQLIRPINRNGRANLLPCRLENEIVQYSEITYPDKIKSISSIIKPTSTNIILGIENLLKEAYLLTPEYPKLNVSIQELGKAAAYNYAHQEPLSTDIKLLPSSGDPNLQLPYSKGVLPYYIGFNFWQPESGQLGGSSATYSDVFLPLMIYWEAEYVYSSEYNNKDETLPSAFLTNKGLFEEDMFTVDYQPTASGMNSFKKNIGDPNYLNISGVISLSSAVTANLQNGIRKFSVQNLNYDPANGKPKDTQNPDYEEQLELYQAYQSFSQWDLLAQGLSGFNSSMLQEIQELQIPINIPVEWKNNVAMKAKQFWITQFLHNQSEDWGANWSSVGLNFNALTSADQKAFFVPLRAGFIEIKGIKLIDIFGRFVDINTPNPEFVGEAMQTTSGNYPSTGDKVYLPPRLVQPSRLRFHWVSAESPDGMGVFTELNPHPAASPICGWLMANHLDDTLMVYDSSGGPIGSVGRQNTAIHWYPTPGNPVNPIGGIRNPVLKSFLNDFIKPGAGTDYTSVQNFLDVVDQSQEFIISPGMQQEKGLAVLIGRPLVLAQAALKLDLKGMPMVSLDDNSNNPTYIPFDGLVDGHASTAFALNDTDGYTAYNFSNFNNGGIPALEVPVLLGDPQFVKGKSDPVPFFDDGLVGFFINDYDTFYTPLKLNNSYPNIKSTFEMAPSDWPIHLKPNGDEVRVTLIIDPRAKVRATSSILPVSSVALPPDQYEQAMDRLMSYFLTAPILTYDYLADKKMEIPTPAEKGYSWSWYQVGGKDEPIIAPQKNMDAVFPNKKVQHIIDGWLKLKEKS